MKQRNFIAAARVGLPALIATSLLATAQPRDIKLDGIPVNKGRVILDMRSRLEHVNQDSTLHNATAATLRTRLGYRSAILRGFSAVLEIEDTRAAGNSYYSRMNGKTSHAVIADPENTEINQASLSYSGMFDTAFTYGRQRILLDNQRFIGNDYWRQNEQTYDAFKIENTSLTDTEITLAYVNKVQTVLGHNNSDGSEAEDIDLQAPLINVEYRGHPMLNVSGYGYFLNFENNPAASRQTTGVRLKGEYPMSQVSLFYSTEYARQSDYKNGVGDIEADYTHLAAGIKFSALTTEFGYEVLSGDGNYAFQTPLASAHAFNGWADQFLVTPLNGLQDVYISADTSFAGIRWKAIYHEFSADRGADDYGNELDVLLVKKFARRYTIGLQYAHYFANDFSADTEKFQIYAQINI